MSIRFQRRIKILPGLRLNISKSSLGLSLGVPGARASINTRGEIYTSAGIPGSGLYAIERINLEKRKRSRKKIQPGELIEPVPLPRIFAPRREKALYRALLAGNLDSLLNAAKKHPELTFVVKALSLPHYLTNTPNDFAATLTSLAEELWQGRDVLASDPLFLNYAKGSEITLVAAPGVQIAMQYGLVPIGLIYVELLQLNHEHEKALEVAESLPPNQATALAVCESEVQLSRWEGVLETTEEVENVDDATALLLIYRAIALRELGTLDAAIESLRRARSSKKRHEDVLNKALYERALTYKKMGKIGLAKKDLEKIIATDFDYPGVKLLLEALEE